MTDDREHPGEGETAVVWDGRPPKKHEGKTSHRLRDEVGFEVDALYRGGAWVLFRGGSTRMVSHLFCEDMRAKKFAYVSPLYPPALHPGATGESVVVKEDRKCSGECASAERGLRSTADPCVCLLAAPVAPLSQPGAGGEDAWVQHFAATGQPHPDVVDAPAHLLKDGGSGAKWTCRFLGPFWDICGRELVERGAILVKHGWTYIGPLRLASPSSGDRAEGSAEAMAMREALERIAEEHDAGRHDGLPEPCPAHDAYTMWLTAREVLDALPARDEAAALASSGGGEEMRVVIARAVWRSRGGHDLQFNNNMRRVKAGDMPFGVFDEIWDDAEVAARAALSPTPPVAASEDVRATAAKCRTCGGAGTIWDPHRRMGWPRSVPCPSCTLTPPGAGQRSAEGEGK